jgi:hypothetical protein
VENDWGVGDDGKRALTALAHFMAGQHTSIGKRDFHRFSTEVCRSVLVEWEKSG